MSSNTSGDKLRNHAARHFGGNKTLSTSQLNYEEEFEGNVANDFEQDDYEVDHNDHIMSQGVEMSDAHDHSLPVPEQVRTESAIAQKRALDEDESRETFKKHRRLSLVLFVTAVVAFVAVIGFMVAFFTRGERNGTSSNRNSLSGKAADVNPVVWTQVYGLLITYSPDYKLDNPNTAQSRAANFMARQVQGALVDVPESRDYDVAYQFVQEYVMAILYYSTDGPNWDRQLGFMDNGDDVCAWHETVDDLVSATFQDVTVAGGFEQGPNGHVIAGGEDSVMGVQCNEAGEVDYLVIPNNNLKGDLPPEVGLLEALQHVSLYKNKISGSIPNAFQYLNDLHTLVLEDNEMTGSIPDYINEQWTELQLLSLAYNNLDGELPDFDGMDKLTQLALNHNGFTGAIDVFDNTPLLEVLLLSNNELDGSFYPSLLQTIPVRLFDVSNNKLTGQIPPDFYDVEIVDVHNNQLSGNVPAVLWDDYDYAIRFFSAYGNPNMEGEIPLHIGKLTALRHLDLSGNGLTGSIPPSVNHLFNLEYLYLGNNDFDSQDFPYLADLEKLQELSLRACAIEDAIPHWMGEWISNLVLLDLSDNALSGVIPPNLSQLIEMRFLLLGNNQLEGPIPDSLWDLRNLNMFTLDHNDQIAADTSIGDVCADDGPFDLQLVVADCSLECSCCDECCQPNDTSCGVSNSPNLDHGYDRFGFDFSDDLSFEATGDDDDDDQDN